METKNKYHMNFLDFVIVILFAIACAVKTKQIELRIPT